MKLNKKSRKYCIEIDFEIRWRKIPKVNTESSLTSDL